MLDAYLQRMYLFDQEEIDLISQYLEEKIDADGSFSEIKYLTPVTKHRQKVL